jgi:membrane protease YdiL (CAAX protease family)
VTIGAAPAAAHRPRFGAAFIDLAARGDNRLRSYAITLICVIAAPVLFLLLSFVAILAAAARHLIPAESADSAAIVAAFAAVVLCGLVLTWCVVRFHRRPWMSLVSHDLRLDWRRLAIGAGVEAVLAGGLLVFGGEASEKAQALRRGATAAAAAGAAMTPLAVALALVLTPLQAATEEMLFRGYLTQALGRVTRSPAIIVAIVGVVFAALHFNAYGALTIPYLFVLSVTFSLVSLRDSRLELTIGAHAANNWLAIAAASMLGLNPTDMRVHWAAVAILAANGALFYAITRFLVRLLPDRPAPP